jgi:DNA-3-methyladenine glycosylase
MDTLEFLDNDPVEIAPRLIGCVLLRHDGRKLMSAKIVETEAYSQTDVASHSYKGETPRTKVMFGKSGHAYIYFTYGMHYCLNVVTGPDGYGSAVLIRAVEPLEGIDLMRANRKGDQNDQNLANGPAKLCQALNIDKRLNGHDLRVRPLRLIIKPAIDQSLIAKTTRIGISQGKDLLWRFYLKDNRFVSRP